ncbi:hypothetical protein MF621_001648 [Bacillus velezensis]|uniref:hypothetical protein n=1 Tax=Bacillus velezensis TaxID=492670 RepID=UPI000BA5DF2C|nr:hypothetical protein [Bacillus velezensis]MEE4560378.1 hypothetical protein [Bacillus velezensis]PAE35623.1 hypothetical protein CHI00_00185 [Bacillus velezensis]URJ76019.1 hypothetical protein MF619_001776 [Bacillus velezensis]URJ79920.1 hypothetical protein MF621_001648 [Bacillus velezensis]
MLFLIVTFILWRKFFVVLDRERPRSCGLCLSLTIREMKTAAKIPTLSGMMKAAGQMSLLKILFLSILAHGMIFTTMFGFTTAYWNVD